MKKKVERKGATKTKAAGKKSAAARKQTPAEKAAAKKTLLSAASKARAKSTNVGTTDMSGRILYLYGLSASAGAKAVQSLPRTTVGVDGESRVESLPLGAIHAWVSRVDAKDFGAELSSRMEDLEWLAETGVRHQRAVAEITERATLLPARFGTVFVGESTLREHVREGEKRLLAAIAKVEGCDEWGVKIFVERPAAGAVEASSGSDYLRQKSNALKAQTAAGPDQQVEEFAAELVKIARDAAATGKVSSGQRGLIWQASFLLPRARRKQWDAALMKWARRWGEAEGNNGREQRRIEATGPWPPYSFV